LPFSISDVSKHNKNLTTKQKKVWVATANNVLNKCNKEGGSDCDAKAIKIANGVVKKMSESLIDIFSENLNLLPENPTEIYEQMLCIAEGEEVGVGRVCEEAFNVDFSIPVVEAESSDKGKMVITFIQSGWSKNGNYWGKEIVEDLAQRMMGEARTQYLNHLEGVRKTRGRKLEEKVSTTLRAWTEENNGVTYGKAEVQVLPCYQNPAQLHAIYETAKIAPWEVGVSVDTWVQAKKGKIDGIEGSVIEKVGIMFASDYVDRPSAGGKVDNVTEDEKLKGIVMDAKEGRKVTDFDSFVKIKDEKRKFYDYHYWLEEYVWYVMYYTEEDIAGKKAMIDAAVDVYVGYIKSLDLTKLHESVFTEESEKITKEEYSDTPWDFVNAYSLPSSAFLIVGDELDRTTWHLPYKDNEEKINKEVMEALSVWSWEYEETELDFDIPERIKAKVRRLVLQSGVKESEEKTLFDSYIRTWLSDLPCPKINKI